MADVIGVGLIGYGAIGRVHALCYQMLPLMYPDLARPRIVGVATASESSAERVRRELGVFATINLNELLARPDVMVVDCCGPTGDHIHHATVALEAHKALLCEKPLASNAEEAAAIVDLAHRSGVVGGVNFHFRQVPALQEARRRIEGGLLGEVYSFHMRYYRSSNLRRDRALTWRFVGPGSGVLVDLGSHLVDLALHLLGPIHSVGARVRTVVEERPGSDGQMQRVEADDIAWLQVELANGGRGTIEVSKMVYGAGDDIRIEAYGSRGSLIFDMNDPNGLIIVEGGDAGTGGRRITTLSRTIPAASLPGIETPTGVLQWHAASIAAFLRGLGGVAGNRPTLEDGLQVDRVLAGALRSAGMSGRLIEI